MFKKKPNFIILIGSDGAGKSTIAQGLSEALSYPVEHHGPVKSYEEGKAEYFGDIERIDYSVIKDRFHEGEAIFAPIYRGYKADYFEELEHKLMEKFNVLLVLVRPPYYIIEERLVERGEDFVKKEHWAKAYDSVNEVYWNSNLPKITIDTNQYTVEQNIKQIISML